MDERSLRILEFDAIRNFLAEETTFSAGREKALELTPTDDSDLVKYWQQQTTEASELISMDGGPPMGGLRDIRPYIHKARVGGVLEPQQLLDIYQTCSASHRLAEFIIKRAVPEGALMDVAQDISYFPRLEQEILDCISIDGLVKDDASPLLNQLRRRIRSLQDKMRESLEKIIKSPSVQKALQEPIVTLRDGRYCIPLKQEYKSLIPGVVHGQSSSGATCFVEPMSVLQLGNELKTTQSQEEEEIQRILREITQKVAQEALGLEKMIQASAMLDFLFAKAKLARRLDCTPPVISDEGWIDIKKARHPLLTGKVVPIDVWLGKDFKTLVITGPNTGGKTVTLKCVGLLVLMAQAGLQIPAKEGSVIPVCDGVYADIGDEQSIEQSLSTFSSHMRNIVSILKKTGPKSLVLLDELGAGTDPAEGAALAMAILEHLTQLDCLTIATTHYSELKSYAYTEENVANASVEFDVKTLKPTYRLNIGVAGSSNAFIISGALGLSSRIIERAKQRLTDQEVKVEDMIRRIESDRIKSEHERAVAERLRKEVDLQKAEYEKLLNQLSQRKSTMMEEARQEAEELIKKARLEAERLIGELKQMSQTLDLNQAREIRQQLLNTEQALKPKETGKPKTEPRREKLEPDMLKPGMSVQITSLQSEGQILSGPDSHNQFVVQVGALRTTVPIEDITQIIGNKKQEAVKTRRTVMFSENKRQEISTELHVRGLTIDEALSKVEKFIDDALIANLSSVRLVHGKGTGTLRKAIHQYLKECPHVRSFRLGDSNEGSYGVTIVQF
jgi:DNA mismatch repair protein MutS2